MSTTIDDKLRLFHRAIFDKLEEKRASEQKKFDQEKEEAVNKKKSELQKFREANLREAEKKADVKANELISTKEVSLYREVLELKSKLIKETTEAIKDRLYSYSQTNDYKEFFMKNFDRILPELKPDEYLLIAVEKDIEELKQDMEKHASLYKNLKFCYKNASEDIIGGFIIEDMAFKFKYDCTLINMLKDSGEEIGILVTEALQ